eukprot:6488202-Amphidinium_carterae.2
MDKPFCTDATDTRFAKVFSSDAWAVTPIARCGHTEVAHLRRQLFVTQPLQKHLLLSATAVIGSRERSHPRLG